MIALIITFIIMFILIITISSFAFENIEDSEKQKIIIPKDYNAKIEFDIPYRKDTDCNDYYFYINKANYDRLIKLEKNCKILCYQISKDEIYGFSINAYIESNLLWDKNYSIH